MDKEFKKKWVAALRSGKFTQGKGQLKQRIGNKTVYCCLGVVACLLVKDGEGVWLTDEPNRFAFGDKNGKTGHGNLPVTALERIGLTTFDQDELIDLNDDAQWSFEQIADYIEAEL